MTAILDFILNMLDCVFNPKLEISDAKKEKVKKESLARRHSTCIDVRIGERILTKRCCNQPMIVIKGLYPDTFGSKKLSKRFLYGLDEYVCLACGKNEVQPIFVEDVFHDPLCSFHKY